LEALGIAPEHARFVLVLDSLDEEDEDYVGAPVTASMKRMFGRMGWLPANPKESVIREIITPLLEGNMLYPNFIALSMMAQMLPVSKPKNCLKAAAIIEMFKHRNSVSDDDLTSQLKGLNYDYHLVNTGYGAKKATKKKTTKKKVAKKKPASK